MWGCMSQFCGWNRHLLLVSSWNSRIEHLMSCSIVSTWAVISYPKLNVILILDGVLFVCLRLHFSLGCFQFLFGDSHLLLKTLFPDCMLEFQELLNWRVSCYVNESASLMFEKKMKVANVCLSVLVAFLWVRFSHVHFTGARFPGIWKWTIS